jgi:acetyl esterase/lipase
MRAAFKLLVASALLLTGAASHDDAKWVRDFEFVRDIPYAGTDDPKQRLDLCLPKNQTGTLPLIVYFHGGAWEKGNKGRGFIVLAPYLRGGRYVGASVEYRFSQDAAWPAQIHDCKAAIRWLRANAAKYNIDPERIAVFGGSAGGHLASMVGLTADVPQLEGTLGPDTNVSSRVTCVVDFCGPSDLVAVSLATNMAERFGTTNSPESKLIGGLVTENLEKAREASPITYVTSNAPPFFIAQGTADSVVPFDQSERLYKALVDAKPATAPIFVRMIGADHAFVSRELTRRVKQFFNLHLYGKPATISDEPIGE